MAIHMQQMLILMACLTTCAHCVAQQDVDTLLSESNPAIQAQLQAIDRVIRPVDGFSNNVESLREIQKLKELTDDKVELVKQVAIFSFAPGPETQPMTAGAILYYMQIPSRNTIRALAPYLDTKNPQLRSFVLDWFHGHDHADAGEWEAVNYKDYLDYIRWSVNRGVDIPAPFIRYIYERSPDRALLVFATGTADIGGQLKAIGKSVEARQQGRELTEQERGEIRQMQAKKQQQGQERREIVLAEHIISNAIWLDKHGYIVRFQKTLPEVKEALATLIEGEWWARLYVAWIMRRNPAFVQPEMVKRLAGDSNELVKETAKAINLQAVKAAVDVQRPRAAKAAPER
jgi:hypothetical protein